MRIAFDIDQTLVCSNGEFPVERSLPSKLLRLWFQEELRHGATSLLRELQNRGFEIWIYTTSARGPVYLRLWFALMGIRIGGVVNRDIHERERRRRPYQFPDCQKFPPAFDIDLLVDDSVAVGLEGQAFDFAVCQVDPGDVEWDRRVRAAVQEHSSRRVREC